MGIKPDDRILEIGCGTGSLIKVIAGKIENSIRMYFVFIQKAMFACF